MIRRTLWTHEKPDNLIWSRHYFQLAVGHDPKEVSAGEPNYS